MSLPRRSRIGRRAWLVRTGVRRGARAGAAVSAFLLVLSGLSINALTAGIQIPQRPAIGPPSHLFGDDGTVLPEAQRRRGPIPRAAFERVRAIPARGPVAYGGDRVYDIDVDGTSYRVHEFMTVGSTATFTITRPVDVEVLIVAGGGGGGGSIGGGGGAGEFIERVGAANRVALTPSGSPYTITVGAGGVGGSYSGPTDGSDGGDSSAFGISAAGGGGGGAIYRTGRPGGSGGGAGSVLAVAAGGAAQVSGSGLGFAGGSGSCGSCGSAAAVAGGGGGAGGVGAASSGQSGGAGGPGRSTSITGIARSFAGGGGGGINSDSAARSSGPSGAGQAGGGAGGDYGTRATDRGVTEDYGQDAVPNSGSGGGGAGNPIGETGRAGGNGGSGIVIVRYEIPRSTWTPMSLAGAGLPTPVDVAVDGLAYREYRFETPGTVTAELAVTHLADPIEMLLVGAGGGGGRDAGGGGGGGALLEGRLAVSAPGVRSLSVTVGAGGARGLWSAPSTRATAGGSSAVSLTTGGSPEFSAVAAGGRAGPANSFSTTDTNGGVSTGAGGVAPAAPTVTGATWQSVTARGGGQGGSPPGTGYRTWGPGGVAPSGGGTSEMFPGPSYGGGGGGGSSVNGYQAAGTNGGGSGSGTDESVCRIDLRATAGVANTGGGGGAGAAYGPSTNCSDGSGLNNRDGEPGGDGIVIIRYPLHREITDLPSEVRQVVAGEGASTAVLRWRVPAISAPSVDLDGYRIEYATTNGNSWTSLTSGVTFSTTGTGGDTFVTAELTGIPDAARHRFRITPVGSIDGPSTIAEPVAKGGDTVTLVGDDVVHQYTTVGTRAFLLGGERTVEHLIVGGGGGGGGGRGGGGGGAGGLVAGSAARVAASWDVIVGTGGARGAAGASGGDGRPSSVFALTAAGGGGGGSQDSPQGRAGGSGGGTRVNTGSGGGAETQSRSSTGGFGNAGGGVNTQESSGGLYYSGGGGGGAGGSGRSGTATQGSNRGRGGSGRTSLITGISTAYAGGGGGGRGDQDSDGRAPGGSGGGGSGGDASDGLSASTATGGGGGGGGYSSSATYVGGRGGSGVVILRYPFLDSGVRGAVFSEASMSAVLRWQEPALGASTITGHRIERSTDGTTWTEVTSGITMSASDGVHMVAITGLPVASSRSFRVVPLHGAQEGSRTQLDVVGRGGDSVGLVGGDAVHQYTTLGTGGFTLGGARTVRYLIVGGGASGTRGWCNVYWGHGGGGGGVSTGSLALQAGAFTATVGAGGAGRTQDCRIAHTGVAGSSSSLSSSLGLLTEATGGRGANSQQKPGGVSGDGLLDGVPAVSRAGGDGGAGPFGAGGGGGAGGPGVGKSGGPGVPSDITGETVEYGRGGAGRDSGGFGSSGEASAAQGPGAGGSDVASGTSFHGGNAGTVVLRYPLVP